jgi:hypothetical protein
MWCIPLHGLWCPMWCHGVLPPHLPTYSRQLADGLTRHVDLRAALEVSLRLTHAGVTQRRLDRARVSPRFLEVGTIPRSKRVEVGETCFRLPRDARPLHIGSIPLREMVPARRVPCSYRLSFAYLASRPSSRMGCGTRSSFTHRHTVGTLIERTSTKATGVQQLDMVQAMGFRLLYRPCCTYSAAYTRRVLRRCPVCCGSGRIRQYYRTANSRGYRQRMCFHCVGTGGLWQPE